MTHADLRAVGGAMGAGMVIALPVTACALAETARVVSYLAEETAAQCGPCMFGLPALADTLIELAYQGGWGRAIKAIATLVPLIEKRGACRHPDGATQLRAQRTDRVRRRRALARPARALPRGGPRPAAAGTWRRGTGVGLVRDDAGSGTGRDVLGAELDVTYREWG